MPDAHMSESNSPLRYSLAPGIHSPVSIQTRPGAACTLRPEGESDPKRCLKAYAGPDGVARFHVRPSWECEEIAKLVIESVKDGKVTHHPLHVRSSHSPTVELPAPPVEPALAQRQMGSARPPLSMDDALRLTDEEAAGTRHILSIAPASGGDAQCLPSVVARRHNADDHCRAPCDLERGQITRQEQAGGPRRFGQLEWFSSWIDRCGSRPGRRASACLNPTIGWPASGTSRR